MNTARETKPDLVILDLMLPGLDGLSVCRALRHEMSIPIMILTARSGEVDRIVGLDSGAAARESAISQVVSEALVVVNPTREVVYLNDTA